MTRWVNRMQGNPYLFHPLAFLLYAVICLSAPFLVGSQRCWTMLIVTVPLLVQGICLCLDGSGIDGEEIAAWRASAARGFVHLFGRHRQHLKRTSGLL
jgi:hypothetical protein